MGRSRASGTRWVAGILVIGITLSACGGGGSEGETAEQTAPPPVSSPVEPGDPAPSPDGNSPPKITGTAPVTVTAGQTYKFQPQASDPDRDRITFTISNKPQWATFDPETGLLTGTPSDKDVGDYKAIEIAATDGKTVVALPEFSITVLQPGAVTRSVALAWDPPTGNSDGTPLTDLAGYRIHYGKASKSYEGTISVDNPSVTRYVVENLGAGTYFFAVTALNAAGAESDFSEEVSTTVN